jgi:hypothetical protein
MTEPTHTASPRGSTDGQAPDVRASLRAHAAARELEERVVQAGRLLHSSRHELLTSLTLYDAEGYWAFSGARTCAHWAADRLDITVGTAREWLRIGHALARLPVVDAAFASGALSYAKVRALTRVAIDHPDLQADLVELAVPLPSGELGRALARWCDRHEDADERRRRQHDATSMTVRLEPDGTAVLTVRLPAVDMERIRVAVDARVMQGASGERDRQDAGASGGESSAAEPHAAGSGSAAPRAASSSVARRSLGQQRALALLDLVANGTGSRVDTEILIHVRADGCTLHDGTPLEHSTVAALIDSSFLRALIHDAEGRPINASGRQRHPTDRQQRVVDERTPRCVDCGTSELLEYDHDPPYAQTRHTVVDELTRRCSGCHRKRHAA